MLICGYALMNVRMMLLSRHRHSLTIRSAARARWGAITATRPGAGARLMFEDKHFNPFIGAGALGQTIDDFNGDAFDHSKLDFVGGAGISCTRQQRPAHRQPADRAGHAALGRQMEAGDGGELPECDGFRLAGFLLSGARAIISTSIPPIRTGMAGRCCAMTFDFPDNDIAMSHYLSDQMEKMLQTVQRQIFRRVTAQEGLEFGALPDPPTIPAAPSWAPIPRLAQ